MAGFRYRPLQAEDELFPFASTYKELLLHPEWRKRRVGILLRDKYVCTECKIFETLNCNSAAFTAKMLGSYPDHSPIYKLIQTSKPVRIHIHHRYYVLTKNSWEYEDDALVCLCQDCHTNEHEKYFIPVFRNEMAKKANDLPDEYLVCPRCGGSGFLSEYNYYMEGVCFGCNGYCFVRKITAPKQAQKVGSIDRFFPDRER
uniref:HNH domain-containing protein n=1 Tax=candidate division WWE3 bacterium TaxID=2053526 RepID=A0A7C4TQ53_UNCKA